MWLHETTALWRWKNQEIHFCHFKWNKAKNFTFRQLTIKLLHIKVSIKLLFWQVIHYLNTHWLDCFKNGDHSKVMCKSLTGFSWKLQFCLHTEILGNFSFLNLFFFFPAWACLILSITYEQSYNSCKLKHWTTAEVFTPLKRSECDG